MDARKSIYQDSPKSITTAYFIQTFKDIQGHCASPRYYLCIVIPEHTQSHNL